MGPALSGICPAGLGRCTLCAAWRSAVMGPATSSSSLTKSPVALDGDRWRLRRRNTFTCPGSGSACALRLLRQGAGRASSVMAPCSPAGPGAGLLWGCIATLPAVAPCRAGTGTLTGPGCCVLLTPGAASCLQTAGSACAWMLGPAATFLCFSSGPGTKRSGGRRLRRVLPMSAASWLPSSAPWVRVCSSSSDARGSCSAVGAARTLDAIWRPGRGLACAAAAAGSRTLCPPAGAAAASGWLCLAAGCAAAGACLPCLPTCAMLHTAGTASCLLATRRLPGDDLMGLPVRPESPACKGGRMTGSGCIELHAGMLAYCYQGSASPQNVASRFSGHIGQLKGRPQAH